MIRNRLSWIRFCEPGVGDTVPDANMLWNLREALLAANALNKVFQRLDQAVGAAGCLPMSGQIIDPALVAAPKQHENTSRPSA